MPPLDGVTLGQKHQHYNKLVEEAVTKNLLQSTDQALSGEDDIANLLKIDVACKTKNLEFLLKVFKSEDLLYVSRAIKNSKWLITDEQYSHIVNPEYLYQKLYPEMTSKAFHKLLLSVRLNLRDKERVESFYKYMGEINRTESFKWLQHCSVAFIEKEVKTHKEKIPIDLVRRLAERSISVFEIYMKTSCYERYQLLKVTHFLAVIDTEKYLDVIESIKRVNITFTPRVTKMLMRRCPDRILDRFEFYARSLDLPTFVRYLKEKQDIKTFLLKQANNEKMKWFFSYYNMEHFIKHISKENFDFVKMLFIEKEVKMETYKNDSTLCYSMASKCFSGESFDNNSYQWYKFAPFDVALPELKKLIRSESLPNTRNLILQVLLSCAGRNMKNVRTVLKYYHEKHINEPFKFKIQFVNTFLSKTDFHEFDNETWVLLNQLFQSMEVYVESDNSTDSCIKAIIIRQVIRGGEVPEIIKGKFSFETLKEYQNKLKKQEDKDAVFNYLNDYLVEKHDAQKISTQSELLDAIALCRTHLNLWNDWNKKLKNFPFLIKRVKNLITTNQENSWNTEMDALYNFNKAWKRVLFNESISLCPSNAVFVNALKHDPGLLARHKVEVDAILKNDSVLLAGLLSKIRIYWFGSLAEEWKTLYLSRLEKPGGHKALVTGLCALLTQKQLGEVAQKFAPLEKKIDWNEVNEVTISLQKQIAKNVFKARPLVSLETIILYAKGDYLQFAVPSLNSLLSQLSASRIRKYLPKLLDSPVSLQKFGVRYAFCKLNSQELKPILSEIWKTTKNSTIRTVLFTHTHALLCKQNNAASIKDIWELLNMFIDNLSTEENKVIYGKMEKINDIPISIRPQFFMKCFTFLKSLPAKANCGPIVDNLRYRTTDIMEFLDDDFVINLMLENIDENFTTKNDEMYRNATIVATFMLSCKDEATTTRRYEKFLGHLLDRNLPLWYHVHDKTYYAKANLKEILLKLLYYVNDIHLSNKINIPVKFYQNIISKLEAALPYNKEYVFLTTWKLAVEFMELVDEHKDLLNKETNENDSDDDDERNYSFLHTKIAPKFAKSCIELLKNDLDQFYPTVHVLFAKALTDFFDNMFRIIKKDLLNYLKEILQSTNEVKVYLVVYEVFNKYHTEFSQFDSIRLNQEKTIEILKLLSSHPSEELKMHYYQLFNNSPEFHVIIE